MLIQITTSIAAGATNENVLTGSIWEFLPFPAGLEFALVGDANGNDLRIDVSVGAETIMENANGSNANRTPLYPDDYSLTHEASAGSRLKIRVRNTNAAAVTLKTSLRITRLG